MTLTKKKLSEKALLAHFQISCWTGRTKDSTVSNEVVINKNADSDSGAWWTYLIPKSALKDIHRTAAICRSTHWKYTLPWLDGGCRILPSAMFLEYRDEMNKVKTAFDKAVSEFIKEYPTIVQNATKRLGKLARNQSLPNASIIKQKFGYTNDLFPLSPEADFRFNDMSSDDIDDLNKQANQSIAAVTTKAMSSVWSRFQELVGKIEETLKQPNKIFRDTLITNLSDFCELLPKMNLTDDNKLEAMRKEVISKLAKLKPSGLRVDKTERKQAAKSAKEMLKKLNGYKI